jgi:outer membrane protein TolC
VLPQLLDSLGARASLALPLTDVFIRLTTAAAAAGGQVESVEWQERVARAQVVLEARAAFATYRRAWLARDIARTALDVARAHADTERARVAAGVSSAAQAAVFETQVATAEGRLASASADLAGAHLSLVRWAPGVSFREPAPMQGGGLLTAMPNRVPALKAQQAQVNALESRAAELGLSWLPRISIVATGDVSAPSPRAFAANSLTAVPTWEVTAQFEFNLSNLTTGIAQRARADAEVRAAQARLIDAQRSFAAQWGATIEAWRGADERVQAATQGVSSARRLAEARRLERSRGVATALDVALAESELVRARLEQADAETERAVALARQRFFEGVVEVSP